ncbi:MAG: succinyl-diaminopimelate desuccinylase [Neomegalonema sp.]|nr:succinyl-diaminopimelate desuccinylase [Neomegalonema sp.]
MPAAIDPVDLTAALVRCPSVTPEEGGALTLLADTLAPFGFAIERVDRGGVPNLYAKIGSGDPVFAFSGHTDVVPTGDEAAWTHPPFSGATADGRIWGRGSVDMKSGVAAFVAAACGYLAEGGGPAAGKGAIALLITGDEEGPNLHGTLAILDWMAARGERMDVCLVGEPTSREGFGDMMKIGRRGSLTAHITARGKEGHVAYPHRAANPLPPLLRMLDRLAGAELDQGTAHFQPSSLQVTTVDVGNPATNVIPAEARATLNIRFNDAQNSDALIDWIEKEAADAAEAAPGVAIDVAVRVSGEAFLTAPGPLTEIVAAAVEDVAGAAPKLDTGGGTSDARFIQAVCPVVEFGLVGDRMHQVDERASIDEINRLTQVYRRVLERYFDAI